MQAILDAMTTGRFNSLRHKALGAPDARLRYDLVYIGQDQWSSSDVACWGVGDWTEEDAGCFLEPTQSKPLVLILNEDPRVLKSATEKMLDRKLDASTVKERTFRYQAHVALHLYRMYLDNQRAQQEDENTALNVRRAEWQNAEAPECDQGDDLINSYPNAEL